MGARKWTRLLAATATCALLSSAAGADSLQKSQRGWSRDNRRMGSEERLGRRPPRGYQDPAFGRGYSDGYSKGAADGRQRVRYDPVSHKDYRDADQGYFGAYGARDAYRSNYRAGFRQGYDEGYRDSTR